MRTIEINGIKLNYLELYPEKKLSILFLHGNSHSHKSFLFQHSLNLSDYRLIFVDIPGHGESQKLPAYSLKFIAPLMRDFLSALEVERVILAGHSLGGHLALNMLKHLSPEGVFIFGTPPLQNPFHPQTFLPNPNSIALGKSEASTEDIEKLMTEMRYTGDIFEMAVADYKRTDGSFRTGILADVFSSTHEDEVRLINSFNGELMILLARADGLINNNYITEVVDTNNQSTSVVEIEAGHSPHVEAADEFNTLLKNFADKTFNKNLTIANQYERAHERI